MTSHSGLGLLHVLVLGGGPDAEREVSLKSSRAIANALSAGKRFRVTYLAIERLTQGELGAAPGDVIFPYLHGSWGEGGQLQDLLEADGRPFVGSGARASRAAMDKIATKAAALRLAIPTPDYFVLDLRDPVCPLDFPVIVKPVHEGSTIGLYVCNTAQQWGAARDAIAAEAARSVRRVYMIEPRVGGMAGARELTVGVLDNRPLPIIEITPAAGLYDYEAKYHRDDTVYTLDPALPDGLADRLFEQSVRLSSGLGCRHVSRVDFMLDDDGTAWLLEINTTPGFTDHSLVPKAAAHAGIDMPTLCARLVDMAVRDGGGSQRRKQTP